MDLALLLVDFILHVDRYLENFVTNYGAWVYALLFLIIFVETGVVVMPFLPGDSLLFVVGALCGLGFMNYPLSMALLNRRPWKVRRAKPSVVVPSGKTTPDPPVLRKGTSRASRGRVP